MVEKKSINPRVSIIIITYNQENYIAEAIQSSLNQVYSNIEIVVADDCSTDDTRERIDRYVEKYPKRIKKVYNEKNLDITGNCNSALKYITGDYLVFMGGDDILKPNKIERQVKFMLENSSCTVSYHKVEKTDIKTGEVISIVGESIEGRADVMLKYGTINPAVGSMYRKNAVPKEGFDSRLKVASDWLFTFECLANSEGTIKFLDGLYAYYRVGEDNTTIKRSHVANIDHLISRLIVLEKYPNYQNLVPYSFRRHIFRSRRKSNPALLLKWFALDFLSIKAYIGYILLKIKSASTKN